MPFLSDEEMAALHVEDLIFHVVGKADTDLVLMDEVAPSGADVQHLAWFLGRLRSTNDGNIFDFISPSAVRNALVTIRDDPGAFVAQSRELARAFQNTHHGGTSKGLLLVLRLSCHGQPLYALMKYDHEESLSYLTDVAGGKRMAKVNRIPNTLVQNAEAIQKAAIIRLTNDGGEMCVRDRNARKGISDYFRTFLAVRRRFTDDVLTEKLAGAVKSAVRKVIDEFPPDVAGNLNQRIYDAIQRTQGFTPEDPLPFLTAIVGPIPEGSKLPQAFARELARAGTDQEAFDFDKSAVRKPLKRSITTQEGIRVIYDEADKDLIYEEERDGRTFITINSARITERDDEPNTALGPRGRTGTAVRPVAQRDQGQG